MSSQISSAFLTDCPRHCVICVFPLVLSFCAIFVIVIHTAISSDRRRYVVWLCSLWDVVLLRGGGVMGLRCSNIFKQVCWIFVLHNSFRCCVALEVLIVKLFYVGSVSGCSVHLSSVPC